MTNLNLSPSDTLHVSTMVLSVVAGLVLGCLSIVGIATLSGTLLKDARDKSHQDMSENLSQAERWV